MHIHTELDSSHLSNQDSTHAWNFKAYGGDAGNSGDFEIYLALPYLANMWMPDPDGSDTSYTANWSPRYRMHPAPTSKSAPLLVLW